MRHYPLTIRAHALTLLINGKPSDEASKTLGIPRSSVLRWAKLAGMTFNTGRGHGLNQPSSLDTFPMSGPGRRLSTIDRARIQAGLEHGFSIRRIARMINASPSTVSREIRRASLAGRTDTLYDATLAHHYAGLRRARPKTRKLDQEPMLRRIVVEELNDRLSPQQIAGRLRKMFPTHPELYVSHETIYQALYVQGKGALRHELTVEKAIRSGRTSRLPQSKLPKRSSRPWLEGSRLSDRPAEAADRAVPGHWEGDLVVGPGNSGLVTLVERASRFALIAKLPGSRDSETVTGVLQRLMEGLPQALKATLTWDQGAEMAKHAQFTVASGVPVFFCDPHSPWQRGSNENLNGLIRDYYPKSTNFNEISEAEILFMQNQLNRRPRQTLEFATPAETLSEYLAGVALTV